MLMGSNNGGIDQDPTHVAEVGIGGQEFEESLHVARTNPANKAVVDRIPSTEFGGKISPGDGRATDIEKGFEEHAVREDGTMSAGVSPGLLNEGFKNGPKFVREHVSHGIVPCGSRKR